MRRIPNYYRILEVPSTASLVEIRRAYRRLVKQYHPDKNPGHEAAIRERFDQILCAYETLSDERKRRLYDRRLFPRKGRPSTHRAELCYRLLDFLLAEESQAALEEFDRLVHLAGAENALFEMAHWLEYDESRDAEFLLAEALERVGRREEAGHLYRRCLEREAIRPFFRRFADDIRERLLRLTVERIGEGMTSSGWTDSLERALKELETLAPTDRILARALRQLAERAVQVGCFEVAKALLFRALRLNPKLSGVRRLSKRLGFDLSSIDSMEKLDVLDKCPHVTDEIA